MFWLLFWLLSESVTSSEGFIIVSSTGPLVPTLFALHIRANIGGQLKPEGGPLNGPSARFRCMSCIFLGGSPMLTKRIGPNLGFGGPDLDVVSP